MAAGNFVVVAKPESRTVTAGDPPGARRRWPAPSVAGTSGSTIYWKKITAIQTGSLTNTAGADVAKVGSRETRSRRDRAPFLH